MKINKEIPIDYIRTGELTGYKRVSISLFQTTNCVMCGEKAIVLAFETAEPLCYNDMLRNNEARIR